MMAMQINNKEKVNMANQITIFDFIPSDPALDLRNKIRDYKSDKLVWLDKDFAMLCYELVSKYFFEYDKSGLDIFNYYSTDLYAMDFAFHYISFTKHKPITYKKCINDCVISTIGIEKCYKCGGDIIEITYNYMRDNPYNTTFYNLTQDEYEAI